MNVQSDRLVTKLKKAAKLFIICKPYRLNIFDMIVNVKYFMLKSFLPNKHARCNDFSTKSLVTETFFLSFIFESFKMSSFYESLCGFSVHNHSTL